MQAHPGADDLTEPLIRDTDDASFVHVRMLSECVLDLNWKEIFCTVQTYDQQRACATMLNRAPPPRMITSFILPTTARKTFS
jgi:hypothetical protein